MNTTLAPRALLDTWNSALDWLFYDVPALTPGERAWLAGNVLPEGSLILTAPGDAGRRRLSQAKVEELTQRPGPLGDTPLAIAVPGVGSSAGGS
jgi:hypothetical protein